VNVANGQSERDALEIRYQAALTDAKSRGVTVTIDLFEQALAGSEAVICRYFGEVFRLSYSDDEICATFYQRVESGMRIPGGDKWDRLRAIADTNLFGERNKREVRFAALTLDGFGLENYGDCSLLLKTPMIAHRASVFVENSVIFMRYHNVQAGNDYTVPLGYKAPWLSRGSLAVAKLASKITATTTANEFRALLLKSGADTEKDHFVEVHVWGPITIRSFQKISVRRWVTEPSITQVKCLEEKLAQFNIALQKP